MDEAQRVERLIADHIDHEYYASRYGLEPDKIQCARHYIEQGASGMFNPTPEFDTSYYLARSPDVAESGLNPFYHYLIWGALEGRVATNGGKKAELSDSDRAVVDVVAGEFDVAFYNEEYPSVAECNVDPVRHYVFFGWRMGHNPNRKFSTSFYLGRSPDVVKADINPFYHYLVWGRSEGRLGHPSASIDVQGDEFALMRRFFDEEFYIKNYPFVAENHADPILHYMNFGWRQGFDPAPDFSTATYVMMHQDVDWERINPFLHHLQRRAEEGALVTTPVAPSSQQVDPHGWTRGTLERSELFDENWYRMRYQHTMESGADPLDHYIAVGEQEGLNPNPIFDVKWYRQHYREVDACEGGALYHYITRGADLGYDPGPGFSAKDYLNRYKTVAEAGVNPLYHYLRYGVSAGLHVNESSLANSCSLPAIVQDQYGYLRPLPVYPTSGRDRRRVVMVTDSVNRSHLFGGVGTALVLAVLFAGAIDADVCVVTIREPAFNPPLRELLDANMVEAKTRIMFKHVPIGNSANALDVAKGDIFITTSWWSTENVIRAKLKNPVFYLLQEDERMFYAHGDVHLRCSEVIGRRDVKFVVNTKLLFDHLVAEGFENIADNGCWFEPAFPLKREPEFVRKNGYKMFFYARPKNERNLFYRGLEAIDSFLNSKDLLERPAELHFVGKDLPRTISLSGIQVVMHEGLSWAEYMDLVSGIDLGLCLMYTPHPSYPPLDLVSRGAVCVTNKFGPKASLAGYSKNLVCSDLSVGGIVESLISASVLCRDADTRRANFLEQSLGKSWAVEFAPVLDAMLEELGLDVPRRQ